MKLKHIIPPWWNKVEVAEAFALVILLTVLFLTAFSDITLHSVTIQGIIAACLTAIFGTEVAKKKRGE